MNHKITLSCFFIFITLCATAQITPTHIPATQIPKEVQYIAKVKDAMTWKDSSGSYVLVLTETGTHVSHSGESFGHDAELHAYCYVKRGSAYVPVWTMHDFIKECQADVSASYQANAVSFTDVDHDGITEVWVVYRTACRKKLSPSNMKIVMHEGKVKYTVKGTTRVKVSKISYEGGDMTFDEAFQAAPESFREYAKKLWSEHVNEDLE